MTAPLTPSRRPPAVEPELLDSLDQVRPRGSAPAARQIGCTLGPGCGCLGLPLAALAGVVVSAFLALAWALRLGRVLGALSRLALRSRGGGPGPRPPGAA